MRVTARVKRMSDGRLQLAELSELQCGVSPDSKEHFAKFPMEQEEWSAALASSELNPSCAASC